MRILPADKVVIDTEGKGRRLRFDATLVNVGAGPLELIPQDLPRAAARAASGRWPRRFPTVTTACGCARTRPTSFARRTSTTTAPRRWCASEETG
jgi:hypothetical protein